MNRNPAANPVLFSAQMPSKLDKLRKFVKDTSLKECEALLEELRPESDSKEAKEELEELQSQFPRLRDIDSCFTGNPDLDKRTYGEFLELLRDKVAQDVAMIPVPKADELPSIQSANEVAQSEEYPPNQRSRVLFRAFNYQYMAFLFELIKLHYDPNSKDYTAAFEEDGVGNLDDFRFALKQNKKIMASQVKHYNHPVSVQDFFNEEKSSEEKQKKKSQKQNNKSESMHIGKFFDGWLSHKAKSQDCSVDTILYTNAALDAVLKGCSENGQFVLQKMNVLVSHSKDKSIRRINKNFLTTLDFFEIGEDRSGKIWEELQEEGYIDQKKKRNE